MSGQITPALVKQLRDRTGVGMGKCKEALAQVSGDIEAAVDYLRKAGMASAVKKESREANEGAIGFAENDEAIAFVEVNAETDFVAQNERFKHFLTTVAQTALATKADSTEALNKAEVENGETVEEMRVDRVQSLGENIQINRVFYYSKKANASYGLYSHMGGKIVCAVELSGASGHHALAREVAMHVAAEAPEYLRSEDVPDDVKQREESIVREQVKGKPENIIDKIVDGKLRAYYEQVCLRSQKFVKDPSQTVSECVQNVQKDLEVTWYLRWQIGEAS